MIMRAKIGQKSSGLFFLKTSIHTQYIRKMAENTQNKRMGVVRELGILELGTITLLTITMTTQSTIKPYSPLGIRENKAFVTGGSGDASLFVF